MAVSLFLFIEVLFNDIRYFVYVFEWYFVYPFVIEVDGVGIVWCFHDKCFYGYTRFLRGRDVFELWPVG